ncbi:glycosyltransferase family A protein [uncultured Culturomica sp.]|uniref:glycosyltransferase family 2 protein n=1 Tax=uncultured Culturomica sp. TaxID=1926654 RepID=UPI00033E72A4|nr:glycosyltransferase family A protein [uncultured Culturomica sp.]CCZ07559.1 glycosyl transferase CpsO [Odoribacter sp. CAG:788]
MVTIFTPTYNRAYIIGKLYGSLLEQTDRNFEWLIVDDGSTDNTRELVGSFIREDRISIRYFRQENGGKHRAINRGVREAAGELFFIVDSDDQLTPETVARIVYHYETVREDKTFAGVCGLKAYFSGEKIGGESDFGILDCNALDYRFKYAIKGDMAEVFRTGILREYPFPEMEGEKFCPEGLVWNRIARKYRLRYFYEKIYLCDYLPDGLTAGIVKLRMKSPLTSMTYYSELYHSPIPFLQRMKAAANYWRFAFCSDRYFSAKIRQIGFCSLPFFPIGFLLHLKDKRS